MKRQIFICLSFILILSSCASTIDIIHYSISGLPKWVEDPTSSISANSITYLGGPSKNIQEARNQAFSGLSSLIILDIKSQEKFINNVSTDSKNRQLDSSYNYNQQTNSAVTLVGVIETNRWRHPLTGEYYIRYEISKDDYEESKIATEKKFQNLTIVDMKLKSAILNLINNPSKSFIEQLTNSLDLYTSIINREWDAPLYVETINHLTQGDIYLSNYISRLISSLSIDLITEDLVCEDTKYKTLEFQVKADLFSDLSQIKFSLTNLNNYYDYTSVTDSSGKLSFTLSSTELETGMIVLEVALYGLNINKNIENIVFPKKRFELLVIHTPDAPSRISLKLANPPWSSVILNWNSVKNSKTYKIFRSSFVSDNLYEVSETSNTYFIDSNLDSDKKYFYSIVSVNKSGTKSLLSKLKSIQTIKKPILNLKLSKQKAYAGDYVEFYWTLSEPFSQDKMNLRLDLTKDNIKIYSIENIPNIGYFKWKIPNNANEGLYNVSIVENETKLTNSQNQLLCLVGSHKHDGNTNKIIGNLSSKQKYFSSGSVCSDEVADQFELRVNALFFHSFNFFVQPLNNESDLGVEIIDLNSGEVKEKINDNGFGVSESRNVILTSGDYLIKIIYLAGAGSEYDFSCNRL